MKKRGEKIRFFKNSNDLVTEIVGTVLLLGITVAVFSTVYVSVMSQPTPSPSVFVNLVGTVEGNNIIIEHRGGQTLSLDTKFIIKIGDKIDKITIGDDNYLDDEAKNNNQWNVGERLVYPFEYNLSNCQAEITAIDEKSNSLVMMGNINITPESDVGIEATVDNENPKIGTDVTITITVTNYRGDLNTTNIDVQYILPSGLIYISNSSTQGIYDKSTGIWNVGELGVYKSATLTITAKVNGMAYTQLAILLDGSSSINSIDWGIMLDGTALAIKEGYIPHNGQVELTVIQFGGNKKDISKNKWAWAQIELGGPIVLNNTNYLTVASGIQALYNYQLGGFTPMSCAFRLAADIMSGDPNNKLLGTPFKGMASKHSDWPRQIVNLVTDGQPNVTYKDANRYKGILQNNTIGKKDTEAALTYYESLRPIEDGDEIDSVAIGDDTDQTWLRDHIVRPQPGYDDWPPTGPGWVHYVQNWQEFSDSIEEQFKILFNNSIITSNIKLTFASLRDPNIENNQVSITIITS